MADVRGDGGLVEDAYCHLGVWRLGTYLEIGITHALSHSVDTNQSARTKEVLALQ